MDKDIEKTTRAFCGMRMSLFLHFLIIKKEIKIVVSMLMNNIINFVTPFICLQELVQSFIINQIIIKSNILNIGEGLQTIRFFVVLMPKLGNLKKCKPWRRKE
jgi:hypothetical protein